MARSHYRLTGEVTAVIFFSLFALIPPLSAQAQSPFIKAQPIVKSDEDPMDKLSPGMTMDSMMRGPRTTALYPTMINSSEPTLKERERMAREAKQWVSEGKAILTERAAALTEATRNADVASMRLVSTQIGEALSRLESGIATSHALERGKPPAKVALRWFKSQLNLEPKPVETQQMRFLGMAPFPLVTYPANS